MSKHCSVCKHSRVPDFKKFQSLESSNLQIVTLVREFETLENSNFKRILSFGGLVYRKFETL